MKTFRVVIKVIRIVVLSSILIGCVSAKENSVNLQKQKINPENDINNPWEDHKRFLELFSEYYPALQKSSFFSFGGYCPVIAEELIDKDAIFVNPNKIIETQDELISYIKSQYGCKDFDVDLVVDVTASGGGAYVEYEPPFYFYNMKEGDKKYFAFFPFGSFDALTGPKTSKSDFEISGGNPIWSIYDAESCKKQRPLLAGNINQDFENKGGIFWAKEKLYEYSYIYRDGDGHFSFLFRNITPGNKSIECYGSAKKSRKIVR